MARQEQRLKEIVAITVPANIDSQQVMRRLGTTRSSTDDFDHRVYRKAIQCDDAFSIACHARIGRGNHGVTIYRGVCHRHSKG